jgi:hypothetical protein
MLLLEAQDALYGVKTGTAFQQQHENENFPP